MTTRVVLRWLFVAVVFGFVAKLGSDDLDGGPWGYLLPVATVLVAVFVLTALHEGGHLLAALALRLKVVAVQVRVAGHSFVQVGPSPDERALPPRFVLMHLAGPAVDFALAFGLFRYASASLPPVARGCVLAAGLTAAVLCLGNVVPHRGRAGVRSDGAQILRWVFQPASQRASLAAAAADPAARG